jgi:hypothetical protein
MATVPSPSGEPRNDAPEPSTSPNASFLAGTVPHGADELGRFGNSIIASAFTHIGGVLLAVFIIGNLPGTPPLTEPVDDKPSDIVWLNVPGPGRRGRDGSDGKPEQKAERPRRDMITLPAATPPKLAQEPPKAVPKPDTEINIQAVDISAGVVELPGALTGLPAVSSWDRDVGGGAGRGTAGRGSGFGTGYDGGIGNGAFGRGGGVTMPSILTEVKPT